MFLNFGEYELDTNLFQLSHHGLPISVEPQVFNVLVYLAKNRDRIISRQELLDQLWSGKVVTESALNSRIKAARFAIGDSGSKQNSIATLNRRGYRFIAEVVESDQIKSGTALESPFSYLTMHREDRPSLAVLPFIHNNENEMISWTAEVFTEEINTQLARIPGFIVISRNSTANYRQRDIKINQVGRELNTDYVIEGSLWEAGGCLRVSVQLSESSSERILWSGRTEIPASELGEFQDDVIQNIVGRIEPELNRAELTTMKKRRPVDLGAWALYRKGNAILSLKGMSEESFKEAADLLRQAIALDPELAFAHAYLSLILAIGHLIGLVKGNEFREEAFAAAEKAISLDSQSSDVLGYAGCAFADLGESQRGLGMIQRAVELDPSNAQAHAALGAVMLQIGQIEGIEVMQHGISISPRDNRLAVWGAMLARSLLSYGKIEEAIETAEHACRSDDKIFLPRLVLAVAQNTAHQFEKARAALADARRIRPQLSIDDIARFANPEEISDLRLAGLL